MTLPALAFVLVFGIVVGSYWLFVVKPERDEDAAMNRRLGIGGNAPVPGPRVQPLMRRVLPMSAIPGLDGTLRRFDGVAGPLQKVIERSGIETTVGTVVLGSAFLGGSAGVLVWYALGQLLLALLACALLSATPYVFISATAGRRQRQFEEQFPEAIDLIARALRAGHAFTTGLSMAAQELPAPSGPEFQLLFDRQNYGMPLEEALKRFADRFPLLDARFFVTAVLTQREAGGNLSEVLDNLATLIRERFRLKRQVRVLSAHGRITGWVLGALAPTLAVILFAISPEHMSKLVTDPVGVRMVVGAILLQIIGVLAMRRIVNIEV